MHSSADSTPKTKRPGSLAAPARGRARTLFAHARVSAVRSTLPNHPKPEGPQKLAQGGSPGEAIALALSPVAFQPALLRRLEGATGVPGMRRPGAERHARKKGRVLGRWNRGTLTH